MARVESALGKRAASRAERAWFAFRATGLRLRRALRELGTRETFAHTYAEEPARLADWPAIIGASHTALWHRTRTGEADAGAEWTLTAGKVENLRVAARRLHGLVIPAGSVFSFWHALGRPSRMRGYVAGRELREGCMVASTGGGLCQLSNALYAAALDAGMEIVERHAHSKIVPGSLAERGLDATVFWNYVDLRFRAASDCVLDVRLDATHLHVRLRARQGASHPRTPNLSLLDQSFLREPDHAHDCIGCDQRDCVEYIAPIERTGHAAWLLDEAWPEFDRWRGKHALDGDQLLLPMDGKRRGRPAYAWSADTGRIREHAALAALRGLAMRLLGAQGAARQRGLLRFDRMLAAAYARKLSPEADRLVIALNLLPHLWQAGVLGGRRYTVLLNRSPLALLHDQLDRAGGLHPQSPTLGDFRADAALVAAEDAALRGAHSLVTPHAAVAAWCRTRYGTAVERLDWAMPVANPGESSSPHGGAVLFPASALGRKGAYEVRGACRSLGLKLRILGQASEGANFWAGVDASPADRSDPWTGVACAVLPAFVEHRPRLLLQALARGLPVLCSSECGLPADTPGVQIVPAGDEAALTDALSRILA